MKVLERPYDEQPEHDDARRAASRVGAQQGRLLGAVLQLLSIDEKREKACPHKKAVVFGATGTIGKAVVAALAPKYQVLAVSRSKANLRADLTNTDSIRRVLAGIGKVDAIVSAAGDAQLQAAGGAHRGGLPLQRGHKLMGQVNLVRLGRLGLRERRRRDRGHDRQSSPSQPMVGSAAISMVERRPRGLHPRRRPRGAARHPRQRGLPALGQRDPHGPGNGSEDGKPAAEVAKAYVAAVAGKAAERDSSAGANL